MSDFVDTIDLGNKKHPRKGSEPESLRRLLERLSRNRQCLEDNE